MKKLGLLTIGQTPRIDFVSEIRKIIGEDCNIVEKGALDGLTLGEVEKFYPMEGDEILVTKMADGTSVKVADKYIIPRLQSKILEFQEEGINVIYLACTGEFPSISSKALIIKPQKVLHHVVNSIAENLTLGVLIPDENQAIAAKKRWSEVAKDVIVESASPYEDISKIENASYRLKQKGIDMVIMDCMGYSIDMKNIVASIIGKPVINAKSMTAKIIGDIIK